jgi:hypothetical protein
MKRPTTWLHFTTAASRRWTLLLLIATLLAIPAMAPADDVITLSGDIGNSSVSTYGMTVDVTLNDPFAYDPLSPTSPLPNQAHPNGFHGTEAEGVDVILSYDMITPVILDAGEEMYVDVWGRNECCFDRDDNFDIEFYNGGVLGTLIGSVTGQAIPDDVPQYHRVSYFSTGTVTIDSFRIVGHDSAVADQNLFTLMETRAVNVDGDLVSFDVIIDRDTHGIRLTNNMGSDIDVVGYSITSGAGALDQSGWTPISGNYDVDGDKSVDPDDAWVVLTGAGLHTDLSEAELAGDGPHDGGTIGNGASVELGDVWIQSPFEELTAELLLDDGTRMQTIVRYVGNDDRPFDIGDLDFNGVIDTADWPIFRDGSFADLSAMTAVQQYQKGDLNGDGNNNLDDFDLFKTAFDAQNGAGAFDAMIAAVPEPASWLLLAMGGLLMMGRRYRNWLAMVCLAVLFVAVTSGSASADILPGFDGNAALGGAATQSTTAYTRPAENAVDGNLGEAGTHTDGASEDPWWQVVFADGDQDIDLITLYNRIDCCQKRLSDITIRIQDADNPGTDLLVSPALNPGDIDNGPMTIDWDVRAANGGVPINGGIVRVERQSNPDFLPNTDDANVLTLNEVQALNLSNQVVVRPNIAVSSPAIRSMSSTLTR